MITGFEEKTQELTEDEMKLVKPLISGFRLRDKNSPIHGKDVVKGVNDYCQKNNISIKMTEVRLRKIVNYIRSKSLLPVMATSKGYYCAQTKEEVLEQIRSLNERANSIMSCVKGLTIFLDTENN